MFDHNSLIFIIVQLCCAISNIDTFKSLSKDEQQFIVYYLRVVCITFLIMVVAPLLVNYFTLVMNMLN